MPTIPIDLGYLNEYRTMRMEVRFGPCGEMLPIKLWCFAAKNYLESGTFPKKHARHILGLLDWNHDIRETIALLVDVGFLYEIDDDYGICGWDKIRAHVCCSIRRDLVRISLPKAVKLDVLAIGFCQECNATEELEVDHIKPVSRGGTNNRENLQCLCATCNARKGAKWPG